MYFLQSYAKMHYLNVTSAIFMYKYDYFLAIWNLYTVTVSAMKFNRVGFQFCFCFLSSHRLWVINVPQKRGNIYLLNLIRYRSTAGRPGALFCEKTKKTHYWSSFLLFSNICAVGCSRRLICKSICDSSMCNTFSYLLFNSSWFQYWLHFIYFHYSVSWTRIA